MFPNIFVVVLREPQIESLRKVFSVPYPSSTRPSYLAFALRPSVRLSAG